MESSSDRRSDEPWPADFAAFIAAYPKHKRKNKSAALRAWTRHKPPLTKVLEALAWQTRDYEWTKEGGKYVPLPGSYINAGGWLDERPPPAAPAMNPKDARVLAAVMKPFPGSRT